MSDISGRLLDQTNNKPVTGLLVQLWKNSTGKFSGVQDITDVDGNFSIISDLITDPDVFVKIVDPSGLYVEQDGNPGFFDGNDTIVVRTESVVNKIPWWVWVLLSLAALALLYNFRNKIKF